MENNNTFASENIKCFHIDDLLQKNFMNGLQNAGKLLENLERSLNKTIQYESRLLRCKAAHAHSHGDQWSSDKSDDKCVTNFEADTKELSRNPVDLMESWSTMSIVCLQYQYEELSKRYESLLRAYHELCGTVSNRDATLARLRNRGRATRAQLMHTHKSLISIGEKYLLLWDKKQLQKEQYKKTVDRMKAMVRGMMGMCEQARLELDNRLLRYIEKEQHMPNARLLSEIRKCNLLYLENMKLKALIEDLAPGYIQFQ
ncbi:hypothetical protein ACJJTC_003731 [Scirpophaga incertulas]